MHQIMRGFFIVSLGTILLASAMNCAVFDARNRRLTNRLDEIIAPESTAARAALAPVIVPVGTASLTLDLILIHPFSTIPDCAVDAHEIIWENPRGGTVRQIFFFIPKVIATPIFFVGDFLLRSMLNVD